MTRRLFFRTLAGATALLTSAKRLVAKHSTAPTSVILDPSKKTQLRAGDRISVTFSGQPVMPTFLIEQANDAPVNVWTGPVLPDQTFFIAPEEMTITGLTMHYAGKPTPVHWKRTSAGAEA